MVKNLKVIIIILILFPVVAGFIVLYYKKSISQTARIQSLIFPLEKVDDLSPLIEKGAEAKYVLLGESSHGTSEYYTWRAEISSRLISTKGFDFVIVEGDWANLYKLNLYVRHLSHPVGGAKEILSQFDRWPEWMWVNQEFLEFVEWLREYNAGLDPGSQVGIYGKDVYGLNDSMKEVIDYLEAVNDYQTAVKAQDLYDCLLIYANHFEKYIYDFIYQGKSCQLEVTEVLAYLKSGADNYRPQGEKEYFNARQNALAVVYGESYYRLSATPGVQAWNSRIKGMEAILKNLSTWQGPEAKGIIWAHNTHVGDARATEMLDSGMINIGQLLREKHGSENIFIVGFGTNRGTVRAGLEWGSPGRKLMIPPAIPDSWENRLLQFDYPDFMFIFNDRRVPDLLSEPIGHRAIGVVYNPANDRFNYVMTVISERYDAFIFLEKTKALEPL